MSDQQSSSSERGHHGGDRDYRSGDRKKGGGAHHNGNHGGRRYGSRDNRDNRDNRDHRGGRGRNGENRGNREYRENGENRYRSGREDNRFGDGSQRKGRGGEGQRNGQGHGRGGRRNDARRGGRDQYTQHRTGPQRSGYREERLEQRANDPEIPADISEKDLDPTVRQDLRSLSKSNAETTARHMVAAAILMADDPQLALRHARAAKNRAGRVAVARETCGIAAYHAGEWKEALAELRAARRMSGGPGLIAVMADCERGLGKPEKAIELSRSPEVADLDSDAAEELAIVVSGAHRDMGQIDEAIMGLEQQNLDVKRSDPESARLFYAYADALAAAGRTEEAKTWFEHTVSHDPEGLLDAADRLAELNAD